MNINGIIVSSGKEAVFDQNPPLAAGQMNEIRESGNRPAGIKARRQIQLPEGKIPAELADNPQPVHEMHPCVLNLHTGALCDEDSGLIPDAVPHLQDVPLNGIRLEIEIEPQPVRADFLDLPSLRQPVFRPPGYVLHRIADLHRTFKEPPAFAYPAQPAAVQLIP
ncbi:hypothetical protein D3C75_701960 [compost metagenome]